MTMTAERWQRISGWFDRLVDLDAGARQAELEALAASDAELAGQVAKLLAADESGEGLLGDTTGGVAILRAAAEGGSAVGQLLGPYRLLQRIGEGGMGEVWSAERIDGSYEQMVAVKLLRAGMDTEAILRRFLLERRILARLRHPNIVRLIDAGMSETRRPYYVMEHVAGRAITEYATHQHLNIGARVALMVKVADAVAHAHAQLVVHRDLKPGNVLVDAEGEPRVLDFGIAKLLEISGEQTRTGTAMQAMSPAYAAPEQLRGEPIGTATDVYALGLLLFELLAGNLPRQRRSVSLAQLALAADTEQSERPSESITEGDGARVRATYGEAADPRQLARSLGGDLDLIVVTALQRDPARRYATAAAFADDLRAWIQGRPIAARADSATYRLRKFVRRHRIGVAAGVLVVASLIGGLGAALWQARVAKAEAARAELEKSNARRELVRTERIKDFLLGLFGESDPISRASVQARSPRDLIRAGLASVDKQLANEPELRALLLKDLGDIQRNLGDRQGSVATLERAWQLQRQLGGDASVASAEAMAAYAVALHTNAEHKKAEPILREALARLRSAGQGDNLPAILAESTLADIELINGNNDEARHLASHGVEAMRAAFGDQDPRLATQLAVLGKIQQESSNYADALQTYNEALRIVALNNGEEHVRTAVLRSYLGDMLRSQRKYAEAQTHYEAALRIERAALPADHAILAGTLLRLGDLQRRTADFPAAEQSFDEALRILGDRPNGQRAQVLQTYAALDRAEGHFDAAARRLHESFEMFRAVSGDSIYTWLTAMLEVQALTLAGHLDRADARAAEAVAALQRAAPDDPYNSTFAAVTVGSLRQAQGRHAEAVAQYRIALAGLDRIYGPDHVESAEVRSSLAKSLLAVDPVGNRNEARALATAAFAFLSTTDDSNASPMLGHAYAVRSRLAWLDGDRQGALADIAEAIARLKPPEYAPRLREALQWQRQMRN
ncbi:MAG: serine/threonine protein kinase [Dokdonella sp.]|nr:MAG: serine/threonine protein kinase [Dokdonella sp.]